jgi:hypothetical protein
MIHPVLSDFVENSLLCNRLKYIMKLSGFALLVDVRVSERGKFTERNAQNDNLTSLQGQWLSESGIESQQSLPSRRGVTNTTQIPRFVENEAQFKTHKSL